MKCFIQMQGRGEKILPASPDDPISLKNCFTPKCQGKVLKQKIGVTYFNKTKGISDPCM